MGVSDIHPKEALPHVFDQFEKQLRREIGTARDLPVKRKDGSIFYVDISSSPVTVGGKEFVLGIFRDITERKKTDQRIQASEIRYRRLFEAAKDGVLILDVETGAIEDVNPYLVNMLGYPAEELLGKKLWEISPFKDIAANKDAFEQLKKKGYVHYEGLPLQAKNGATMQVEFVSNVYAAGEKQVIQCNIRDITERKIAQDKLRKVNRTLLTISEANQVSVRAADEDELLKDVCDVLVKNAGYKLVWVGYAQNDEKKSVKPMAWAGFADGYIENLNISWADTESGQGPTGTAIREKRIVVNPDFSKDPNLKLWSKEALKRGYVGSVALPLYREDRVLGALNIYSSELGFFDSDEIKMLEELADDLAFSVASIRNKREKEKAFVELEHIAAELRQFKRAVDNASDHIIITDPDAKIVYANRGAERITGYSVKEMIGKTPALWGKQMPKEFYERMWHTIKTEKESFVGKVKNRRKNGENYLSEFSISPILNDRGDIIFFVGVERDITKEEEVDRSKSEFVSLASHQLRTPLSAINWYAEMLLGGDAGVLTDKQKDYTSEIYASSRRMAELVGALLNVSRIELGTFAIEPKPTDIRDIADSVIKELEPKISAKNQAIVYNYSEDVPDLINIDPNLTRMILQNLISNSVKYTPDGGRISIAISKTENDVVVRVADNGYGIPLNQQGRVFEKFFRADNIIPVETDGTGLGLYIVKEVVEKSGGKIGFESEENVGTTFVVSIPISGMKQKLGTRSLNA